MESSTSPDASHDLKATSSVQNNNSPPPFGSRFLTEDKDVWSYSAWDHVPAPEDQEERVTTSLERQRNSPVPDFMKLKYNGTPERYWNKFYKLNSGNFFKDRKWLNLEFPELLDAAKPESGPVRIVEIGCGAGNAVFPLLAVNKNPLLDLRACDYSEKAIEVVKSHELYSNPPEGTLHASVWDLASHDALPEGVEPGTVDIAVMIFVLSALHPNEWQRAMANVYKMLKPGGKVFLRDYGRHDLAQLRFKEGRLLSENFYVRGDGTRVYFFELDELSTLFTGLPIPSEGSKEASPEDDSNQETVQTPSPSPEGCPTHPLFATEQLGVDRRLLVNRKRQLKMYRVWMQGKFRKL